jgi:peptidyl-prolyl cis-trans isomerase C
MNARNSATFSLTGSALKLFAISTGVSFMSFSYRRVSLASLGMAVGLSALALAPLAAQEQAPAAAAAEAATPVDPKAVVATVDGQTITEADLELDKD